MKALENEANNMNVTINAGKANVKFAGKGIVALIAVLVIIAALTGAAMAFKSQFFTGVGFIAFIGVLISFNFIRIIPQKPRDGQEKTDGH